MKESSERCGVCGHGPEWTHEQYMGAWRCFNDAVLDDGVRQFQHVWTVPFGVDPLLVLGITGLRGAGAVIPNSLGVSSEPPEKDVPWDVPVLNHLVNPENE